MTIAIRPRLLVLEDNVRLVSNLFAYLEPRGYELDAAQDGDAGLALATHGNYHALIVDWGLPSKEGVDVIRDLRSHDNDVPVLVLTARGDIDDKVCAFRAGADDYLTKPFAMAELEVRIEALIARRRGRRRRLVVGELVYDLDQQHVMRGQRIIPLSSSARGLLEALMRASPAIVTRAELEEILWGDQPPEGDMLRSHVYELRRAIDGPEDAKLMHTVRGVGYYLGPAESAD